MAVVNTNSDLIANAVATPRVPNPAGLDGGVIRSKQALVAVANGDSATSTLRLFRLPSCAYVRDLDLTSADIGTTTAADVGLYYPTTHSNGGTVIDVDAFASAVSLSGGAISLSTARFESGAAAGLYTNYNKRLWEQAGLTSDPGGEFDVVLTLTGAADAAGTVLARVAYTV
jgi:hypothetical protein